MAPSQTFPMAALPRDPVCWAVYGVSSALKLAGGTTQLILTVPPCWVAEKQGKSLLCGASAWPPCLQLDGAKSTRHPVKLGLGMALWLCLHLCLHWAHQGCPWPS